MTTLMLNAQAALAQTPLAQTGNDLAPWIIGGAVVLVIVGVALLVLRRRS